ncbi:hypothetical protein [Vibrio sp.]|uniref:hypothetical protein n=1 Tax=Vibrio sp. TaxID=678 RepID=UPI003AA9577E
MAPALPGFGKREPQQWRPRISGTPSFNGIRDAQMHNHPSQQDSSVSDEAVWNDFVQGMLGELADPMTYEQAAKDAIADHRTERQFEMMGGMNERL